MEKEESSASILFIGYYLADVAAAAEGILAREGRRYTAKSLLSSPANWMKIIELLERHDEAAIEYVAVKLTEGVILLASQPEYQALFKRLCELILDRSHIVFVYAGNLRGEFSTIEESLADRERFLERYTQIDPTKFRELGLAVGFPKRYLSLDEVPELIASARATIDWLLASELNICPYETNRAIKIALQDFFENAFGGLLMRIYVPGERIYSTEIDRLITLFADYLQRFSGYEATLATNRTGKGLIYEFYAPSDSLSQEELIELFQEFTAFLDLAGQDPQRAADLIAKSQVPPEQLQAVLGRYAREAKRLALDIEHERERKFLSIRQRLEAELLDLSLDNPSVALGEVGIRPAGLQEIVAMPDIRQSTTFVHASNVIIGNPQLIQRAEGIIAQELRGNIEYNEFDEQLLDAIRENAGAGRVAELETSLNLLKDETAPQQKRQSAWQSLRTFLTRHADVIGKAGVNVLEKYLEHVLTKS